MNTFNDQTCVIDFLSDARNYPESTRTVQQIETHGAIVFLTETKAYKLKKAVYFPYMDYSTVAQRHTMCERELELNRRTAPEIYLAVLPITRDSGQKLAFNGHGAVVDWVVVMRRFDPDQVLDLVADRGELTSEIVEQIAQQLVQFHQAATVSNRAVDAEQFRQVILGNDQQFADCEPILRREQTEQLTARSLTLVEQHRALFAQRLQDGKIKHCHGDLHLHNICLYEGEPRFFDAIEFNEDFAEIDVLYDLAFLLMDLDFRGLAHDANTIFNYYCWHENDYTGVALLPLFLATRAAIRAHVNVAIAQGLHTPEHQPQFHQEAQRYLAKALNYLEPKQPQCVAIGGLSGTGKSTLAQNLAPYLDTAPGALILRSDVIRKRYFQVPLTERLPEKCYSSAISRKVYTQMFNFARIALQAGHSVIVDCLFVKPEQRHAIATIAEDCQVPFHGLWLEVPTTVAYQRIETRQNDASDATVIVRRKQNGYDCGEITWARIDASRDRQAVCAAVKTRLNVH